MERPWSIAKQVIPAVRTAVAFGIGIALGQLILASFGADPGWELLTIIYFAVAGCLFGWWRAAREAA